MKIGNLKIENNIFLAPMAGITDLPFRLICKKYGAGLVYTEMISAKALYYGDEKTKKLLVSDRREKPLAVQIFGSDTESIKYAVKYLNNYADIIDINMGCPAPKVTKNGDGSKLLLNLDLIKEIIQTAVDNASVPVTIKIRKGWDNDHIVALEVSKIAEKYGASAITIHGRTRSEFYLGQADWNIIKRIKESVKIPVIGNGDIKVPQDAKKMFDLTNSDAVMIGRGSIGNPWIFKQANEYIKNEGNVEDISNEEKLNTIIEHLELACKIKGENIAVKEMRKHIAGYTRYLDNASQFRNKINMLTSKNDVENELKKFFKNIK